MKLAKRALLTLLLGVILTLGYSVTSDAAKITQTAQTQNSVTIKFSPDLYSSQTLTGWTVSLQKQDDKYNWIDCQSPVSMATNVDSYTFNNLAAGNKYYAKVSYSYQSSYGSSYTYNTNQYIYTLPGKVSGVNQDKWWFYAKSVNFSWNRQSACNYEWAAYKGKKKVASRKDVSANSGTFSVKNNVLYKVKVRSYVTINNTVYYGDWSDDAYLFTQPMVKSKGGVTINSSGKMTVKWDKISGISKYQVYVSTKEKTGYKKVATVSSKKGSVTVSKLKGKKFNKNKTYFVYIVATKKVGKKTYTSGRHYSMMYKNGSNTLRWSFD